MSATCIMNNCRRKCPDDEPFCSVHRDKTVDWKARAELYGDPAESITSVSYVIRRGETEDQAFKRAAHAELARARQYIADTQAQRDEARADAQALDALKNDDWFVDVADFLDQYQDAEIIDGTTHPNKAMRLLAKLQELGL